MTTTPDTAATATCPACHQVVPVLSDGTYGSHRSTPPNPHRLTVRRWCALSSQAVRP